MCTSFQSQRTSLVQLFRVTDQVTQVKQQVDETLDICGAAVVPEGNPEAGHTNWGDEDVPAIFKPLLHSPQVPLVQEVDELDLSDIVSLDPQITECIQQKARDKAVLNRKHAKQALHTYDALFCIMYSLLANFTNVTSDSVRIYLRVLRN